MFITRGITPAHAGKTVKQRLRVFARQDHPRACGENGYVPKRRQWGIGSPPRMRGKLPLSAVFTFGRGITPAHAGKTPTVVL